MNIDKAPASLFYWDCLLVHEELMPPFTVEAARNRQNDALIKSYMALIEEHSDANCRDLLAETEVAFSGMHNSDSFHESISRAGKMGAGKHGHFAYRDRLDPQLLIDAVGRHLLSHVNGQLGDAESGLPHLTHIGANLLILIYQLDLRKKEEKGHE